MDNIIDTLQIKIEEAQKLLPEVSKKAIAAVDWKTYITSLRQKKGFSFEQLGDLEIETELVLCGLVSPEDYPTELAKRMKIGEADANWLVEEMNINVFSKIKQEMIKILENKDKNPEQTTTTNKPVEQTTPAVAPVINPQPSGIKITTILNQKLGGTVKTDTTKTDHSLQNVQGTDGKKLDPYRELPE